MGLKYTGNPRHDWIPGVPARDLTDEEQRQYPQAELAAFYKRQRGRNATIADDDDDDDDEEN